MRKPTRRAVRVTAVFGSVAALVLLPAASASAAATNSSAYAVKASLISGAVNVGPLATSTCPPGGPHSVASAYLGTLGSLGALNATSACDDAAGTSSATASAATVALLAAAPGLSAVAATLISATCSGAAPDDPIGSSTLLQLKLGTATAVDLTPTANTILLDASPLAKIVANEQTLSGGVLTVNALHIYIGPIVNGAGSLGDVIIGHVSCGPNVPTAPGDVFSFQNLPLILGGIAVLVMIGMALRTGTRRLRGLA